MSSSLKWRPADPPPPPGGQCGVPLKSLIVQRFWDAHADGSLTYSYPILMQFANHGEWLRGIIDAGDRQLSSQAKHLRDDLLKYGSLELIVE
jgi:hypothetical protein